MPPRLARLLAVVAAIAMIGGAFWWRGRGGDAEGSGNSQNSSESIQVLCVTELAEVCRAIDSAEDGVEITIESAGETTQRLAAAGGDGTEFDAWLTFDPWPGMANVQAGATETSLFDDDATVQVANTQLGAVMPRDRAQALLKVCGDPIPWACVAENAGQPWSAVAPSTPAAQTWGTLKVGVGTPDDALGRLVFGQLVASVAADAKLDPNDGTGDFDGELIQLLRSPAASTSQSPIEDELQRMVSQPGSFSLVASDMPSAEAIVATPQGQDRGLAVIATAPATTINAVLAPLAGSRRGDDATELFAEASVTDAFTAAGWSVGATTDPSTLPAADVLAALQEKIR